jgi:glycosyltransferase involved in cell wall biosynthesis
MKILFIHHYKRENLGDYRGSIPILSQELEKKGHEVRHIAKKEWFGFHQIHKEFKPDIIVCCGQISGVFALLKRFWLIRTPIIFHWGDNYEEMQTKRWKKFVVGFLEKFAARHSDAVISISKYRYNKAITNYQRIENQDVFYIPLGYNPEFLKNAKKIPLPGTNKFKVIYAGEISNLKNFDRLKEIFGEPISVDFIILGPKEIDLPTTDNVFYLGFKKPEEIYSYYKSGDFILVTEDNDSSLKLFEAQVFGKPVLCPTGRIATGLNFHNNVYYTNFEDIEKLIQHIGKNNRAFTKTKIKSWSEIATEYEKILKDCSLVLYEHLSNTSDLKLNWEKRARRWNEKNDKKIERRRTG